MTDPKEIPEKSCLSIPVLFFLAFFSIIYLVFRTLQYPLSIDPDEWGILVNSKLNLLTPGWYGDSNKFLAFIFGLGVAYFDAPILFVSLSIAFGAGTCFIFYLLVKQTIKSEMWALLAWVILLISPMLYHLVLTCNSVLYSTFFVLGALYFFDLGKLKPGCIWILFAGLSRPEPTVLIAPIIVFLFYETYKKRLAIQKAFYCVFILSLAPIIWVGMNLLIKKNWLWGLTRTKSFAINYGWQVDAWDFPLQFWNYMTQFYFNPLALCIALFAILYFLPKLKNFIFLYNFFIFFVMGFWGLAYFKIIFMERHFWPVYIFLLLFTILLFFDVYKKIEESPFHTTSIKLIKLVIPIAFLALSFNLKVQNITDRVLRFHAGFNKDSLKVAKILKKEISNVKKLKLVSPGIRHSLLTYYLIDKRERIQLISFRRIFQKKSDFKKEDIHVAVFSPDDMRPLQSAFYNFELISNKGLKKQGLKIKKTEKISERTQLIWFEPDQNGKAD